MKLQTPVIEDSCKVNISYNDKIMMLGSCFSDNIGRQLLDYGFNVYINPFGTLYNPVSILKSVERILEVRHFNEDDCIQIGAGDERFCSFSHHTSFARKTKDEFLNNANAALVEAAKFFMESRKVIITLGTAWCFRHISKDMLVSNCLKRPSSEFVRERLSVNEITETLKRIMELCPDKEFIFTVSPIRHFKDGAHGNQISKSSLLVGIDDAIGQMNIQHSSSNRKVDYFPAYEIVMDQLRDYRFYAEDMCHPSQQAVDYIRRRFLDWALPTEEHQTLEERIRSFKRSCHKETGQQNTGNDKF